MAHPIHCDPRTLLKQLAIPLVQRLFEQRGELLDLPWSELRQKKQTAPIYAAWQRLPEDRRREVQIVFHEIAGAATELGIAAFAQEVKHAAPGDVWKFNACRSRLNKALWFFLNFPELFERATLFARADSLTTGRFAIRRDDLPRAPINVTPGVLTALGEALRGFYWPTQMRGHHCHVEHHRRHDGDDYFFAYLDDWPDKRLAFGDNAHDGKALLGVIQSDETLVQTLWLFCEEQAEAASIDETEFGRGLDGPTLETAINALEECVLNFSRPARRTAIQAVREKAHEVEAAQAELVATKVRSPALAQAMATKMAEVSREIDQQLATALATSGDSATSSRASSASIPVPTRSGS